MAKTSARPHVLSNLAISLDGKIAPVNKAMYSLGTAHDLAWLLHLRDSADVVVMGASTLRAFRGPCFPKKERDTFANVVLTDRGEGIDPDWPFFHAPRLDRYIFHSGKIPRPLADRLLMTCHLVPLKKSESVARQVVQILSKERGLSRILVEGGGHVMWEFVREDLIDDFYVTLTPKILGGVKAPSLVAGSGFPAGGERNLKLVSAKKVKDEIYLHYRKLPAPKKSTPSTKRKIRK